MVFILVTESYATLAVNTALSQPVPVMCIPLKIYPEESAETVSVDPERDPVKEAVWSLKLNKFAKSICVYETGVWYVTDEDWFVLSCTDILGNCRYAPPVFDVNGWAKLSIVLKYWRRMLVSESIYLWSYSTGAAGRRGFFGGIIGRTRNKGNVIYVRPV
jgi:hypothetical protein